MQNRTFRTSKQETLPNAIILDATKNWTVVHEAAATGDDGWLQTLLASNVDRISKESTYGNTPLHEAAIRGYSRCVKLFCKPPNPTKTALKGKSKASKTTNTILALHNTLLGIGNNEGFSALHMAVQNGHNQCCRELLLAGADPDIQNNYGDTPIHTACRYGHAGVARILISACIDPNKRNLNGDTALHIACAMGRRKLTRILLEANAQLNILNLQSETPYDIAIRKGYSEIVEILNSPIRIRVKNEKQKNDSPEAFQQKSVENIIKWSPYGCHYFPDPRSFPTARFETLPEEPLQQGEQYYLDLAGNIRKGPISIAYTCYCGPFFRDMENKLNCNRKSIRKLVSKTKQRFDHKVHSLAIKTNDQIEQLTQTMIADRKRCESRRIFLNEYLKRGELFRSTMYDYPKQKKSSSTHLIKSRSLELLNHSQNQNTNLKNAKSFDILENNEIKYTEFERLNTDSRNIETSTRNSDLKYQDVNQKDELNMDFSKVSEKLVSLLEKTNFIMEKDKTIKFVQNHATKKIEMDNDIQLNHPYCVDPKTCSDAKCNYWKCNQCCCFLKSSNISNLSPHTNPSDCASSTMQLGLKPNVFNCQKGNEANEKVHQSVRKDLNKNEQIQNGNYGNENGKISEQNSSHNHLKSLFLENSSNPRNIFSKTLSSDYNCSTSEAKFIKNLANRNEAQVNVMSSNNNFKNDFKPIPIKNNRNTFDGQYYLQSDQNNGIISKVICNSEIKHLKKRYTESSGSRTTLNYSVTPHAHQTEDLNGVPVMSPINPVSKYVAGESLITNSTKLI